MCARNKSLDNVFACFSPKGHERHGIYMQAGAQDQRIGIFQDRGKKGIVLFTIWKWLNTNHFSTSFKPSLCMECFILLQYLPPHQIHGMGTSSDQMLVFPAQLLLRLQSDSSTSFRLSPPVQVGSKLCYFHVADGEPRLRSQGLAVSTFSPVISQERMQSCLLQGSCSIKSRACQNHRIHLTTGAREWLLGEMGHTHVHRLLFVQ